MSSSVPGAIREQVRERDQGRCIVCMAAGTELMHRVPRRDGGHRTSNLAYGCHADHARAHASPKWGYDMGIMASRYGVDLTLVPVRSWRGWVLLDDEGGYHVIAPRSTPAGALSAFQASDVPQEG